jgi:hypothetical protein
VSDVRTVDSSLILSQLGARTDDFVMILQKGIKSLVVMNQSEIGEEFDLKMTAHGARVHSSGSLWCLGADTGFDVQRMADGGRRCDGSAVSLPKTGEHGQRRLANFVALGRD